jgi:putative pre-16S rRNA nuclease
LAIDLGTVRLGLALSDPLGLTAQPLGRLERKAVRAGTRPIADLVRVNEVVLIVVGHPLLLSGEIGERARDAEAFAERLRQALSLPVELWDERLTTVQAEKALIEGDVRRRRRRDVIDAAAATLLLQSWLDAHAWGTTSPDG